MRINRFLIGMREISFVGSPVRARWNPFAHSSIAFQLRHERARFIDTFPSFGRGFDSDRPLHKSRRFNCLYAAESLKIPREMVDFGRQMDAAAFN